VDARMTGRAGPLEVSSRRTAYVTNMQLLL
jgi:hypothetical protein